MAILLSANAPARAQLDFATQTDTRYPAASSGDWVEISDTPAVILAEPRPADGSSSSQAAGIADPPVLQSSAAPRSASLFPSLGQQQPHPAVVRIIAAEPGGASLGSGTLVDSNDDSGLIITNWHVVRDAPGSVIVLFPDGFQSMGQVLRMDSDWDLAAILVKKPQAAPVRVAREAPRLGETLTIAGYGSGSYRAAAGACTQYLAPSTRHPFELVELAASARQGDSGGPIFNSRGELAGVLFGEGGGRTTGAYCGRVHNFLTLAVHQLHQAKNATLAAKSPAAVKTEAIATSSAGDTWRAKPTGSTTQDTFLAQQPRERQDASVPRAWDGDSAMREAALANASPYGPPTAQAKDEQRPMTTSVAPTAAIASADPIIASEAPKRAMSQIQSTASTSQPILPASTGARATVFQDSPNNDPVTNAASTSGNKKAASGEVSSDDSFHWKLIAGDSLIAQLKTVLAGIGLLACLFHGTRMLARTSTGGGKSSSAKKSKNR